MKGRATAGRGLHPAIALTAIALCGSGCALLRAQQQPPATHTLGLPAGQPSVLLVITDPHSAAAMKTTTALVEATARPAERLIIMSESGSIMSDSGSHPGGGSGGPTLASSTAPPSPSIQAPAGPSPLPSQATTYQRARYAQAVSRYKATLDRDRAALHAQEQAGLIAWARSVLRQAELPVTTQDRGAADIGTGVAGIGASATGIGTSATGIGASLDSAAAVVSSLRQLGTGYGTPVAVAVTGVSPVAVRSAPGPGINLQGAAVAIDDFPGSSGEEAAWQSSLLQAGATRVTMLSQATDNEFAAAIGQDLDAVSPDVAVSIRFGLGQYTLSAAAEPRLRQLLRLLTTRYAHANVTINGYTDELPAPGGNLRLSELRARSVAKWLTGHGIAPGRLQNFGDGTADAVGGNTASGQPLDRRVIVVINPAAN